MPIWSDGTPLIPNLSFRTYYIIKDGLEIDSLYGTYSDATQKADELNATQIYDAGDFYMTSYGVGKIPKEYKSKTQQQREIPKKLKAFYFDGEENFEFIEIYCETLECEMCQKEGAYYIEDGDGIGLCMTHLKEQYDKVEAVQV